MLRQLKQKFRRKSKAAFETTALGKLNEEELAQIALTSEENEMRVFRRRERSMENRFCSITPINSSMRMVMVKNH